MVDVQTSNGEFRFGSVTDLTTGESWNADRLSGEINRRLDPLHKAGVGAGARVVIAHDGRPAFFSDLFAVWELGGCAVCVDPQLTGSELQTICDYSAPRAVLVARDCPSELPSAVPALELEREPGLAARSGFSPRPRYPLEEPALILFTSGTTGNPKGVVHSYRSLLARIDLNRRHIGGEALARTLCVLPTHFGHGLIGNCLTALLSGHHLQLNCGGGIEIAANLRETIMRSRITFMSSVPAFWKIALRMGDALPRGLIRRVNVGSAPLSSKLWMEIVRWSGTDNVSNMYGMTETANWFSGASACDREPEDGLVGRPWGGAFGVDDGEGGVRSSGEGELLVRTPSLMCGYFQREDLTAEVLSDGWYRTGDVGHVGEDGTTHLTGRVKYEINRAGVKVQPEEIDLLLETHEAVDEACAFGIPDEYSGEAVAVAICGTPGSCLSAESLRKWCLPRIHKEAIPARWYFVDEIPKTERGKLNRELLRLTCLESGA